MSSELALHHIVEDAFGDTNVDVACIKSFSKGVIVASGIGHFRYWKKFDSGEDEEPTGANKKLYLHTSWGNPSLFNKVISLDINQKENILLAGFQSNQIATCNLAQVCSGDIVTYYYRSLTARRRPLS